MESGGRVLCLSFGFGRVQRSDLRSKRFIFFCAQADGLTAVERSIQLHGEHIQRRGHAAFKKRFVVAAQISAAAFVGPLSKFVQHTCAAGEHIQSLRRMPMAAIGNFKSDSLCSFGDQFTKSAQEMALPGDLALF